MRNRIPMNLQLFADPTPAPQPTPGTGTGTAPAADNAAQTVPAIDYDKIQQMLTGTLQAKEDTALKAYFKQQGLSDEEMQTAIADFKAKKAASQPDVAGMQTELNQTKKALSDAQVASVAQIKAMTLGIDAKSIPYVLKLADLSGVIKDGKVNEEAVTAAINKVLEDVPAFKPAADAASGFHSGDGSSVKIGAGGNPGQAAAQPQKVNPAPATKRWNRFH